MAGTLLALIMKKNTYDFIVSIGEDCGCTTYLRRHELQHMSYPFDWLTGATLEQRVDTICHDFGNFFQKDNFQKLVKKDLNNHDHDYDYYRNDVSGFTFLHDFTAGMPFVDALPLVVEKYNRRIKRFYEEIEKSPRVLLVWFSQAGFTAPEVISELHARLCIKFGKNVDLLLVEHDASKQSGHAEKLRLNPHVTQYKLVTATDNKKNILGNKQECDPIFRQYKLAEPAAKKISRYIYKKTLTILFSLIPNKALRRKLKRLYIVV
jgi:Putative papain-like cysteine peptidase (DUF1796)